MSQSSSPILENGSAPGEQCLRNASRARALFRPFHMEGLTLPNRVAMAPMTRGFCPNGVPGPDVADYYRRRAEAGVGLIITEGTWIPHPLASYVPTAPDFFGDEALGGWSKVVEAVHQAGGKIFPQLWHVGISVHPSVPEADRRKHAMQRLGPSGTFMSEQVCAPMTQRDIDETSQAYVDAAVSAWKLGFDGVELHGAHGYLIDQFLWQNTNRRQDCYGGGIADRTKFVCDVIKAIKKATHSEFPIGLRISQFKLTDFEARIAQTPAELEALLSPIVASGVSLLHCSQRRFWQPAFEGSDMSFAGWTRKLSGKPVISVGSVSLDVDFLTSTYQNTGAENSSLDQLFDKMEQEEIDLIAVGRALIADSQWATKVKEGRWGDLTPYSREQLTTLH